MSAKNSNGLVSIIVPVYKVENYIRTCIESVIDQTYVHWELILVDDGTPDQSGKICDEYARLDDRIRVIHKTNGGLSDARNVGLELVSGNFIAFLDSDDFWHQDYLFIMMSLQAKCNADIVQCKWTRGNESVFPNIKLSDKTTFLSGPEAIANGFFDVMMWGKIYKRSMLDGIKMPVGLINEDDWTSWKICYRAKRFVMSSNKLYYYTFNQQGICAKSSHELDLCFFGAFEEKRLFFMEKGDSACSIWNLAKWNKAIILKYRNEGANDDQRLQMMRTFRENYKELCTYPDFKLKSRIYFLAFMIAPMMLSNLSEAIRNFKRDRRLTRYKKV